MEHPTLSGKALSLLLLLALGDAPGPCAEADEGTNLYYSCLTGEDIDLGLQDEADETISKGRE